MNVCLNKHYSKYDNRMIINLSLYNLNKKRMKKIYSFGIYSFLSFFDSEFTLAWPSILAGPVTSDSSGAPIFKPWMMVVCDSGKRQRILLLRPRVLTNQSGTLWFNVPNVPDFGINYRTSCQNPGLYECPPWLWWFTVTIHPLLWILSFANIPPPDCHASFTYYSDSTQPTSCSIFFNTSTHSGDITSLSWDFGDGST